MIVTIIVFFYFHVKYKISLSFYHYICPYHSRNVNDIFRYHSHDGDFMGTMRDLFYGNNNRPKADPNKKVLLNQQSL